MDAVGAGAGADDACELPTERVVEVLGGVAVVGARFVVTSEAIYPSNMLAILLC